MICLGSKMYAFNYGNVSKNKLKGICKSHSKNFKLADYKKCLDKEKYQQQIDNDIIRFLDLEMYRQ